MKTIVIGDLMLDKYVFGIVERVSPESGCPILKQTTCEYQLGEPTLKSKACFKWVQLIKMISVQNYRKLLKPPNVLHHFSHNIYPPVYYLKMM